MQVAVGVALGGIGDVVGDVDGVDRAEEGVAVGLFVGEAVVVRQAEAGFDPGR